MSTNPFEKLDLALDAFAKKAAADRITAAAKVVAEREFAEAFASFRSLVARPALEEIGAHLTARGHGFDITTSELDIGPCITLNVIPNGSSGSAHAQIGQADGPQFVIIGDTQAQRVQFRGVLVFQNGGPIIAGRGDCPLAEATTAFVLDKAVACIAESFSSGARA